jgi:putative heme-binding domain-containing protein
LAGGEEGAAAPVRRWSFAALQAWPAIEVLPHLLACERDLEPGDESLALTWRIAVREHLKLPGAFMFVTGAPSASLLSIILAVPNQEAAQYVTKTLKDTPSRYWEQSLSHIARHGDNDQLAHAIAWARSKASDSVLAVQSLSNGLSERGTPPPPELLTWAHELAVKLLVSLGKQQEPVWTSLAPAETAPAWSLQPRKCSDGTEAQVLQSMIKGGGDEEKRTGMLRSKTFIAPAKLALWINGHRGLPTAKAHDKNLVRIVDAKSGDTLASAFPPRSNDCRRIEFDLAKYANKQVRLEIVDGDDGKAYAWLGITRIEPPVIRVDDFKGDDATRASLKTLAVMLQHSAPAALREKLAAYLPPRPAPPPLPVSPEQRKQLDALITQRVAAFAKAKPDMVVGKNVFTMTCAVCHQIGGQGGLIGPQLDGIGARGVARLCEDILDPNRNVDAHFHVHTLTMKDGSIVGGFLKAELGQIHLLADATGKEHRLSKKDIEKTAVTPISLMPPTFGQTLDEATFIDLLGYLLNEKAGK